MARDESGLRDSHGRTASISDAADAYVIRRRASRAWRAARESKLRVIVVRKGFVLRSGAAAIEATPRRGAARAEGGPLRSPRDEARARAAARGVRRDASLPRPRRTR